MAFPRHPADVNAQMPDVRSGLYHDVHRLRRFRFNRPMDPNSHARVLLELIGMPCAHILAQARRSALIRGAAFAPSSLPPKTP